MRRSPEKWSAYYPCPEVANTQAARSQPRWLAARLRYPKCCDTSISRVDRGCRASGPSSLTGISNHSRRRRRCLLVYPCMDAHTSSAAGRAVNRHGASTYGLSGIRVVCKQAEVGRVDPVFGCFSHFRADLRTREQRTDCLTITDSRSIYVYLVTPLDYVVYEGYEKPKDYSWKFATYCQLILPPAPES